MKLGLKMVELLLICMLSLLNITNIFIFHWLIRISVVLSKTLQISISCRNESNFGRNKEKTRLWFVKRGAYPKKFRNSKIRIKLRLTLRNQKKKRNKYFVQHNKNWPCVIFIIIVSIPKSLHCLTCILFLATITN